MASTKVTTVFGVNENGELVATGGTGSTNIVGYIPTTEAPVDSNGSLVIVGLGGAGGTGTNGKSVLSGSGAPSNATGTNGDFYIDTVAHYIYGPKASGAWPAGVNMIGPQGIQGIQGVQGNQGPAGPSPSQTLTAYEAIPSNSLVYIRSDGQLALANATAEGKEALGFVATGVASGAQATAVLFGKLSGLISLVPGASYYMSTTSGAITDKATASAYPTGSVLLKIGSALSATELLFNPATPITM